jgi:protein-S-isoprenylcysteine O-methyltransferase Ste14
LNTYKASLSQALLFINILRIESSNLSVKELAMALPDFNTLSLVMCILLGTYTTFLCGQPPNPTPYDSKTPDSMKLVVSPSGLFIRLSINLTLGILHALLTLNYPSPNPRICPNPSNLNPSLFTWTPRSTISVALVLLGSAIRLSAFRTLGQNFTFRLAKPKTLITSGMYKYVQHPSYTGAALIAIGNFTLLLSPSGVVGCWLPAWLVQATPFWRAIASMFVGGIVVWTWKRVCDEEAMMKETFGKEWEEWHKKTWRFIPGFF